MPAYLTSLAWTGPIAVAAGDVLQNSGTRSILVCAEDDPDADDSLLIRPRSWYTCAAAMTIRAATHGVGIGCLSIASGLGEDDGVEPVEPTAPGTFAPHQWTVSTGAAPGAVIMDISGRPSTGGAALIALEYTVQDGEDAPGTALAGLGTGQRVLTMPDEDTEYSFRVRGRNSVGPGPWSEPKAAVSGEAAELPSLEATITPNPLVAGDDFEILFSAAPDSVSPLTLVRDANDPRRYTGTAPASGIVTIGATKAGYTAYSATFEASPALPDLIVSPAGIFAIANATAASEPETINLSSPTAPAEMMGEWEIDFAPLASGPVLLRDPYITGTPAVGQTMTLHLPPPLSLIAGSDPTFDWSWPDGSKGKTYVIRAEDAGVPYDVEVTLTDGNGARSYTTNAVSVPAAAGWYAPTWKRNGEVASRGTITGPDGNGDLTIGSDGIAGGNTQGNPRVYFDVVPGDTYELETHIEWGNATRVIGRLSDMTSYNTAIHVNVFDVTKPAGDTTLSRTDTFTPAAGRVAMYYIFTMDVSGTAKILSNTRVRQTA
ncbi:hypothetical protein PARHAE_01122 [Paracoccus haematequi]|uniref:Fibronectin type-III domain-containing protein n=1 Tax=Paracoccus haematequi TaxID=2491866 RepID=A0A3S4EQX3_9RHOB|nr:fibronectin type III domain-containing protein [Paracoccus haematequi]VDS07942.1 hypothetical protein PARHAE_01122 [Paracoccus haematequi]